MVLAGLEECSKTVLQCHKRVETLSVISNNSSLETLEHTERALVSLNRSLCYSLLKWWALIRLREALIFTDT